MGLNYNSFKSSSFEKRIDLILSFEFDKKFKDYDLFVKMIKEQNLTSDSLYNALIIELAEKLNIQDIQLLNKYLGYLRSKNNSIIKLSVLDYLSETYKYYTKNHSVDFKLLENIYPHNRKIVNNQIILLQILIDAKHYDKYLTLLFNSIKQTNDYRSHIRNYNFIADYLIDVLPESYVKELVKHSASKKLGKAVDYSIKDILSMY